VVPTQEQRTEASTAAVLAAATELFGSEGFLATSVSRIAQHAAVSKSGLLHHFGSKEEVFRQVFVAVEEELAARTVEGIAHLKPRQQIEVGARSLIVALQEPRIRQIALVDGPAVLGWAQWREIEAEHAISIIVAVLEAAAARDELAIEPTEAAAGMLLAVLHEAAFTLVEDPDAQSEVEALFDRFVGAIFLPTN